MPRVLDMLFQRYSAEVDRRALSASDRARIEAEVKNELREKALGGRVRRPVPVRPRVPGDGRVRRGVPRRPLHHGYGMTEAGGGVLSNRRVRRPPRTGVPARRRSGTRLLQPTRHPHPRGELLLDTETIFKQLLQAARADGVGLRRGRLLPDRRHHGAGGDDELVYIDRRTNVL
ncbi:hypothetical protein [Streptomyces sp. KL116D]|uniref:hypothetical protein n=1 Tax=Streptomyces sp. KL116D TaxID=3045152 RepID=UPI003555D227